MGVRYNNIMCSFSYLVPSRSSRSSPRRHHRRSADDHSHHRRSRWQNPPALVLEEEVLDFSRGWAPSSSGRGSPHWWLNFTFSRKFVRAMWNCWGAIRRLKCGLPLWRRRNNSIREVSIFHRCVVWDFGVCSYNVCFCRIADTEQKCFAMKIRIHRYNICGEV